MDKVILEKVCQNVYKRFPVVKGQRPKVSKQADDRYLLVFSSSGKSVDGQSMQHMLRVVAAEDGRILKTSMSR
jgi:hypothetical protein